MGTSTATQRLRREHGSIASQSSVATTLGWRRSRGVSPMQLGWAKTYDAEYVALASLLGCRLVTVDGRLRRGADRLGFVLGPTEL